MVKSPFLLLQTVNAQDGDELRLERLKHETQHIKQHNEKLECSKEKPFNKPPSEVVPDSEVSLINLKCIQCF